MATRVAFRQRCERSRSSWLQAAALITASATLIGCGGGTDDAFERTAISGTVTVDGQPLKHGEIYLIGAANEKAEAAQASLVIHDGKFESSERLQPGVGENEVIITIYDSDPAAARSQGEEPRVLGVWQGRTLLLENDPLAFSLTARQLQK